MTLSQGYDKGPDHRGQERRSDGGAASASATGSRGAAGRAAATYTRVTGPVLRGPTGIAVGVVFFAAGAAVGGHVGLAIASAYVTVIGAYCLLNFLICRETHCGVTGPGFLLTVVLGFAAALAPGTALAWYNISMEGIVFLAVLAVGYGLEGAVAARTGRRALR